MTNNFNNKKKEEINEGFLPFLLNEIALVFQRRENNDMYHIRVRACALIIENDAVLLVEFQDENGLHYNLPAGGVERGESLVEAVKREALEEAGVEVEVGPIAFVHEIAPHLQKNISLTSPHQVSIIFECKRINDSFQLCPTSADENQTGVKWIPLSHLSRIILYPNITQHIIEYANHRRPFNLIEEHTLSYE
jgi:8-oxo-dGTP diphosphatase